MYQKNLYQVPVDMETQALLQALRDGRLFIQPASVPACDTRAEVLSIITRIAAFASDERVVLSAWQALLADDARLRSFRLTQKRSSAWQSGSGASPLNRYRIAAIVRHMCEIGLYDVQKCKSANQGCGFRGLCQLLFPGEDADLYRRGCTNYAYYEDECLIDRLIASYSEEGCRYE